MSNDLLLTLAQANGPSPVILILYLAILIGIIIGFWRVFEKAGQPGWAAIVPIYNVYILCKIAGRPGWWVILFIIPIVSIVVAVVVSLDVAKAFGKGLGFALGLVFLGFIFYPILGFGDAKYLGPQTGQPIPA